MTAVKNKAIFVYEAVKTEGATWLAYRAKYSARKKLGLVERQLPSHRWSDLDLANVFGRLSHLTGEQYLDYRRTIAPPFLFNPAERRSLESFLVRFDDANEGAVTSAEELLDETARLFAHTLVELKNDHRWNSNPVSGQEVPADPHWSRIDDFDFGDIKAVWDLNRFGFTYPLVRAYWRTGDERYSAKFWTLFEHWLSNNQPQSGPNWKCGQETSIRLMAWCFALYGFLDSQETTGDRLASLAQAVFVSANRIRANIDYSLSQRNNHGISEATGLWTAGTLFPELQGADEWKALGRKWLERQGRDLIYDDGAFSQHSMNYHRLMLHDYLWALRLGDVVADPLSDVLRSRVAKAGEFLYELQDEVTGHLPCYGQNDGSLILQLTNCDYQDFRPVIQASQFLGSGTRAYQDGPWDEEVFWLFGIDACKVNVEPGKRSDFTAPEGGYYTFRNESSFGFVRSSSFRHRPGEADQLHFDLWWRGLNLATDAGTYSYNATEPWEHQSNVLSHTSFHNTVSVDGVDQMDRVTRFLWLPWVSGKVTAETASPDGWFRYWQGEHDGYLRLSDPVTHRRAIVSLGAEHWLILDRVFGERRHDYRLHWLLADEEYQFVTPPGPATEGISGQLLLSTAMGPYTVIVGTDDATATPSLVRADPSSPRGWRAPYYYDRLPALSLALERSAKATTFWTLFGPGEPELRTEGSTLTCRTENWEASVQIASGASESTPIVSQAAVAGSDVQSLLITQR